MEMVMEDASRGVDGKWVQRPTVVFDMAGYQNVCTLES
jgi:nicotinamidase-related amidase